MNAPLLNKDAEDRLAEAVRRELALLGEPIAPWVPETPTVDTDVVVIGAGQTGISVAFALWRSGITRVRVLDARAEGREGPWRGFARMRVLRSPKHIPGPELGLPSLTFRAWYDAVAGPGAFEALGNIPTETWARYLDWYRRAAGVSVENGVDVRDIARADEEPDGTIALTLDRNGRAERLTCLRLAVATGMDGLATPNVPAGMIDSLPDKLWAHTTDGIDFEALAGKKVAVIGAASSAFDNAATALEAGAAKVDLFCRRPTLETVNRMKGMRSAGLLEFFADLPDAQRWELMHHCLGGHAPPIRETVARATRHPNFRIHFNAELFGVSEENGQARIDTAAGSHATDFLILGTGYRFAMEARPELARLAPLVARWRDRYRPPEALRDDVLAAHPYLGDAYQFLPREADAPTWIGNVYLHCFAAIPSHGRTVGECGSFRYGVPRLARGIGRSLTAHHAATLAATVLSHDEPETSPDEYMHAVASPAETA